MAIVMKYPRLVTVCKVGALASKLARESFFGKDMMAKCTVFGQRDKPPLPKDKVCKLKQFLIEVLKYDKRTIEFEVHWKLCIESINHACNALRAKKPPSATTLTPPSHKSQNSSTTPSSNNSSTGTSWLNEYLLSPGTPPWMYEHDSP